MTDQNASAAEDSTYISFSPLEGEELFFGQGPEQVALPSALLCNIQLAVGRVLRASGAVETIDKILEDEENLNCGNLEGDYGLRVSVSYLERELRALQGLDELVIDQQDSIVDPDSEDVLPVTTYSMYIIWYPESLGRIILHHE
ncbi:hypothetical protein V1515DRAFT_587501 [Lipomyces mesembrius]